MYNVGERERKAHTMQAILEDYFQTSLSGLRALDVGASTGIIDNYLANCFDRVTGIDIDEAAIGFAQKSFSRENLTFELGDAMKLRFEKNSFDVVICSQVYEHVPNARLLFDEIFRVLKPGGICYFAAGNRLMWNEPHYNLPLLSVLPRFMAHYYLRLFAKGGFYYERHFTLWGLAAITQRFKRHDYTQKIIVKPERFFADYLIMPGSKKRLLANFIVKYAYWLCPGYIWLLEKPDTARLITGTARVG